MHVAIFMTSQPLRIGTAGWSVASRYADRIPPVGSHLERYARRLNAVEINSSFYKPHQRKTYEKWAASVPADFRFAVKIPKTITHGKKFVDCDGELLRFADEVAGLGDGLSVLLVQLPPKGAFDADIAGRFFETLRKHIDRRVALEPRHASWFTAEVDAWLSVRAIARVAADPAKIDGAGQPGGDRNLTYYRWHGSPRIYYSDYDAAALAALRKRLVADQASGAEVWCVFDNTASGAALGNALSIETVAG